MLPVPIETLRVRIGLDSADASRDDDINAASATALALMGNYCDRGFDQVVDFAEEFTHFNGTEFLLFRYPIVSVQSITDENSTAISAYHIARYRGIIELDMRGSFHQATVIYTGGYAEGEFPPDLLSAYYAVFDQEFATVGTTPSSGGELSSVTVQDVGTVRFATSSGSDGIDPGSSYIPSNAAAILNFYKRYKC